MLSANLRLSPKCQLGCRGRFSVPGEGRDTGKSATDPVGPHTVASREDGTARRRPHSETAEGGEHPPRREPARGLLGSRSVFSLLRNRGLSAPPGPYLIRLSLRPCSALDSARRAGQGPQVERRGQEGRRARCVLTSGPSPASRVMTACLHPDWIGVLLTAATLAPVVRAHRDGRRPGDVSPAPPC